MPFPVGASHSLELRYLFEIGGAPRLNAPQQQLSDQMLSYWTQFVTTGVPAVPGGPVWPPVNDAPEQWMQLRPDGSRVITDFAASHQCPFWAGLER